MLDVYKAMPIVGLGVLAVCGTSGYVERWKRLKDLPHYKYLARPVYKFVAARTNPIVATAVSFFVTDLIMHQLLPQVAATILVKPPTWTISWSPSSSLVWISLALPVMYAKYKQNLAIS